VLAHDFGPNHVAFLHGIAPTMPSNAVPQRRIVNPSLGALVPLWPLRAPRLRFPISSCE